MTSVLHTIAATSRPYTRYILVTIQVVLLGALLSCNSPRQGLSAEQAALLNHVPDDVRTVLSNLGLEPDFMRYACCRQCFAIYPPNPDNPDNPYPHKCTFEETDKGICDTPLVIRQDHPSSDGSGQTRTTYDAILTFPYRPLQSWLADMVARPGIARYMKSAWKASETVGSTWKDIFEAPCVREFLGPDGKTPFASQPEHSTHLIFSLFIDWFNPYGNKKAGKSHSIGAIYLVCMNLPDHLRYRPENIYLAGIIPGPKEPETSQINHLLRPLVDELLVLWYRGMIFANVADQTSPLLVCGAMIPLVCDIPALRKAGGFAGHSAAHFCSFCELPRSNMNSLHRDNWPRHSWEEHVEHAKQWLDAQTDKDREDLFKQYGIRWSELLRLDYWDPTRFAVVDAMHNLFLGELRHHCRDVWGISVKDTKKIQPHDPKKQAEELKKAFNAVKKGALDTLCKLRKGYVVAMAEINGVAPIGGQLTKKDFGAALIAWVRL